ncbi:protein mono-ADP-ribosyltransferase PARP14-like [Saccoglossus kowalevskii]
MSIGLSQDVTVKKGPRNSDSLILEGSPNEVMNVFSDITDFLNIKKDEQVQEKKAELYQNRVQWCWYDGKCKQMVAFDPITNMLIEDAHQKNLPSVSYELNDNGHKQSCQIDFNTEEEIILTTGARNKVVREDLELKAANQTPSHWVQQPLDANGRPKSCHRVALIAGSSEYQKVQSLFGSSNQIYSIERIQNPHLWQQYSAQKDKMEQQNQRLGANEMDLFHGTGEASLVNINEKGFNRSFSGRAHGTALGNGTYFAKSPSTSMGYAKAGPSGKRYMYRAKVLAGEYTRGSSSIVLPPAKNPNNPFDVYDTTVDNPSNPSVFVIFHDNQAYPEYLIAFR